MNAPHIWVPKVKILEPRRELLTRSRMAGFYRMQVFRPDGRLRKDTGFFPNLITDAGLNHIGTESDWLACCKVGEGNTAPANGNTALVSWVAGTGTTVGGDGTAQASPPYFGTRTITWQFATGVAEGNLAEVGVGEQHTNAGVLFSRALILDGGGSPTTLTVLSDEILNVTYQLRRYPPLVDVEDTVELNSIPYDFILRAANVTSATDWAAAGGIGGGGQFSQCTAHDGAIGAITTTPSGATSGGSVTNAVYGNNNLYRDFSCDFSISQANFAGGVDAISVPLGVGSNQGRVQVGFTPAIPKTSSDVLSITLRHIWARGSI